MSDKHLNDMTKKAWFGKYYHAAFDPKAESSILKKGLLTSHGGRKGGAAASYLARAEGTPLEDLAKRVSKETKGKVSLSRSKLLSKIYGLAGKKDTVGRLIGKKAKRLYKKGYMPKSKAGDIGKKALALLRSSSVPIKEFIRYQPLEVKGRGLKALTRDPSHFFLGVQSSKNIAPKLIRKSKQSGLGRLLKALL